MPRTRHKLTEHFAREEFDCRDGTPVPVSHHDQVRYLCRVFLEPMRKRFGPCRVVSGFRTPSYNRSVGGARLSFHVYTDRQPQEGVASDVIFERGSVRRWWLYAKWLRLTRRGGRGGIGFYPQGGFVHIDTRDYKADWNGS